MQGAVNTQKMYWEKAGFHKKEPKGRGKNIFVVKIFVVKFPNKLFPFGEA